MAFPIVLKALCPMINANKSRALHRDGGRHWAMINAKSRGKEKARGDERGMIVA
jgi:hypothetical protein